MAFHNLVDMHVHSDNSFDGHHSAMLLCEHAERAGLRAMAVTDHCDCQFFDRDGLERSIKQSYFEAGKAQAVYRGRMLVLKGIELGQPNQNRAAADLILSELNFDFVLASLHNLSSGEDFYYLDYSKPENDWRDILRRYFDELLTVAEECDFDSLAHMTYPARYFGLPLEKIDFDAYKDITDKILSTLVQREKALEINTAGLRKGLGWLVPHNYFVRRFKELGGKYVTVGSDAHYCTDVGADIETAMTAAYEAGFGEITIYQDRRPVTIPIKD